VPVDVAPVSRRVPAGISTAMASSTCATGARPARASGLRRLASTHAWS
jgi:hypothetical protein